MNDVVEDQENETLVADREINLIGKQCPMTFVYTKVALEKMETGQVLRVTLDFRNAFTNIPKSVKKQELGEILQIIDETETVKSIWIKKS